MKTKYAWSAGIIDGEGCIGIWSNKKTLTVHATNTDKRILLRLKEIFNVGDIYIRLRKDRPNNLPCGKWIVTGKKAYNVLKKIKPYLISKKEEAEIAIRFGKTINRNTLKNREYRKILINNLKIIKGNKKNIIKKNE